jgi:hypothetical protein
MIYLKRLWNLIGFFFSVCVCLLIAPLSFVIELYIISPILYILKNEYYIEKYDPFTVRVFFWLTSNLTFNTNKK